MQNNKAPKPFHLSTLILFLKHQSLLTSLCIPLDSAQKTMSSTIAEIQQ